MKKILLIAFLTLSPILFAQKKKIPANVKAAFEKEFPSKKAKWELENGGYEAEFEINDVTISAVYDTNGYRKELEITIKTSELPKAALNYLKKKYSTNEVKEAAKITDDKNVITFEAEIKQKGKSYDLLFDDNGKFMRMIAGD